MRTIERRLSALEQRSVHRGMLTFRQSLDNPAHYTELRTGEVVSRRRISELSAQGWQCLIIEYTTEWNHARH